MDFSQQEVFQFHLFPSCWIRRYSNSMLSHIFANGYSVITMTISKKKCANNKNIAFVKNSNEHKFEKKTKLLFVYGSSLFFAYLYGHCKWLVRSIITILSNFIHMLVVACTFVAYATSIYVCVMVFLLIDKWNTGQ